VLIFEYHYFSLDVNSLVISPVSAENILCIKSPPRSRLVAFKYKHYFSILLRRVANVICRFPYVVVGAYAKQSHGGTFSCSNLSCFLGNYKRLYICHLYLKDVNFCPEYFVEKLPGFLKLSYIIKPCAERNLSQEKQILTTDCSVQGEGDNRMKEN
jgi:hypothetical protein